MILKSFFVLIILFVFVEWKIDSTFFEWGKRNCRTRWKFSIEIGRLSKILGTQCGMKKIRVQWIIKFSRIYLQLRQGIVLPKKAEVKIKDYCGHSQWKMPWFKQKRSEIIEFTNLGSESLSFQYIDLFLRFLNFWCSFMITDRLWIITYDGASIL